MEMTFLNASGPEREEIRKQAIYMMGLHEDSIEGYEKHGLSSEDAETEEAENFFWDNGDWYDYGLSFDFVDAGTFSDQPTGYYRYQFSWGGPSDELRFYPDGMIEYVFMDWGTGIGFDVSGENWANWIKRDLEDCMMIDWDSLSFEQIHAPELNE